MAENNDFDYRANEDDCQGPYSPDPYGAHGKKSESLFKRLGSLPYIAMAYVAFIFIGSCVQTRRLETAHNAIQVEIKKRQDAGKTNVREERVVTDYLKGTVESRVMDSDDDAARKSLFYK
jgi:hypothetical protein